MQRVSPYLLLAATLVLGMGFALYLRNTTAFFLSAATAAIMLFVEVIRKRRPDA